MVGRKVLIALFAVLLASLLSPMAVMGHETLAYALDVAGENRLYVVALTSVIASIARQLGGDYVEVHSIVPAGFCPGHYDITPGDVAAVAEADVIIGHRWPWFEDLAQAVYEATGKNVSAIFREVSGPWNTPEGAIAHIKAVASALCEFEENATRRDYYIAMNETICSELLAVTGELKAEAEEFDVGSVKVICMQWQVGFVQWLGFDIVATFGPPERLSPEDVANLVETGRSEGVALVIDNLQSGTELGAAVAREIGAEHVVLTNFPDAVPGTPTLVDMMRYNAAQLFNATESWRSKGEEIRRLEMEIEGLRGQNTLLLGLTASFAIVAVAEAVVLVLTRRGWRKAP